MKEGRVEFKPTYQDMIDEALISNEKAILAAEMYFKGLIQNPCTFQSVAYGESSATFFTRKKYKFTSLLNFQ